MNGPYFSCKSIWRGSFTHKPQTILQSWSRINPPQAALSLLEKCDPTTLSFGYPRGGWTQLCFWCVLFSSLEGLVVEIQPQQINTPQAELPLLKKWDPSTFSFRHPWGGWTQPCFWCALFISLKVRATEIQPQGHEQSFNSIIWAFYEEKEIIPLFIKRKKKKYNFRIQFVPLFRLYYYFFCKNKKYY